MFFSAAAAASILLLWGVGMDLLPTAQAHLIDGIKFHVSPAKLPFPVSDIMANYVPGDKGDENGFVIITGGCNSIKGNERVNFGDGAFFACLSTSKKTLKFDPFTETFTELADMPRERQRHGAAVIDGELYVIGGRDSNDDLVAETDSYNIQTNTWTTRGSLPDDIVTSDLTAWAYQDRFLYVAGGFEYNYTAVGQTYRLDLLNHPTGFGNMGHKELATSPHPRGDIHAVVEYGYAYMAGGLTHTSFWCTGLQTTERYHMATDTWETLADLSVGRADMAVTLFNGKIVAIGGESKPENCLQDGLDPAYGSFPVDQVEAFLLDSQLDPSNPTSTTSDLDSEDHNLPHGQWVKFEDFHDNRFRFAAVTVPALNRIYTFGGQVDFDFTKDGFPTSNLVTYGEEYYVEPPGDSNDAAGSSSGLSSGAIAGIVLGVLAAFFFGAFGYKMLCTPKAAAAGPHPATSHDMSAKEQQPEAPLEINATMD